MREIKFRAYDGRHKRMYYGVGILNGIIYLPTGKKLTTTKTLMQYTGLKDKNGKEIYFGDILQTSSDDPETDMWKPDEWGYTVCVEDPEELGVTFKNWYPIDDEDNVYNWKYVEVIGNIYENPDLLNK